MAALTDFFRSLARNLKRVVLGRGESLDQKRSLTRLRCRIPVLCQGQQSSFEATVVDIGLHGMRLEVPHKIAGGQIMAVSYKAAGGRKGPEKVVTQVRWCRKKRNAEVLEAGVEYVERDEKLTKSWVDHVLDEVGYDESSVFEKRRSLRAPGRLLGYLETRGGRYSGSVANLGLGGALLEVGKALARGTPVEVEIGPDHGLDALRLEGKIAHVTRGDQGWLNGVVFSDLAPAQAELLGQYIFLLMREAYG